MAPISDELMNFESKAVKRATKQLKELAARYDIRDENTYVAVGSPAHQIRELAKRLESDLIVIGTHGRHGLGLLLGSTASGVLHGVSCDVLAVRFDQFSDTK